MASEYQTNNVVQNGSRNGVQNIRNIQFGIVMIVTNIWILLSRLIFRSRQWYDFWTQIVWYSDTDTVGLQRFLLSQSWPFNPDIFVRISNDCDKMVAICLDFKWLGFRISDPIQNTDRCNPTSFWPSDIQTSPDFIFPLHLDESGFGASTIQIPTAFDESDFRFFGHSMFEQRGETSTESCFLFYGPCHEIHRTTAGNGVTFYKKKKRPLANPLMSPSPKLCIVGIWN